VKIRAIIIIIVLTLLVYLVGCSQNKITELNSPLVFYGESNTWSATLFVEQSPNERDNTFEITQISNLTYKGDYKEISTQQIDGEDIPVHVSIEGIIDKSGGSSSKIQEFIVWRQSSTVSEEYATDKNELEVIVDWKNKKETFTMTYDKEKSSELKTYDETRAYTTLSKPQNN
jgi:hypothetical protein